MRAIILESFKNLKFVKDYPIPEAQANQVLIKVESAPVNPSDLEFINGSYVQPAQFPVVVGLEGSGTVIKSGGGAYADSLLNKRVAFSAQGSYSEYVVASVMQVVPLQDSISFNQGASSFVNPLTAIVMLNITQKAEVKAVVFTAAASQLGRMVLRLFNQNGIKVIGVVRRKEQADILKGEGAEFVINQQDEDHMNQLKKLAHENNATIFFDAVSGKQTGQVLNQMPNGSTAYVYGGLSGEEVSVNPTTLLFKEQTVKGLWLTSWLKKAPIEETKKAVGKVQELLASDLKTEISKESSLSQYENAIKFYKANMSLGKVVFKPQLNE